MPYIPQGDRDRLTRSVDCLHPSTLGELNYAITELLLVFRDRSTLPIGYATYASIIGVLETCKLEFYRRAIAPYEDEKIAENGDVF